MNAVVSATRAACCMLCVTMTIVKRSLELVDQLLDLQRRDRVQRRARLVHQDHLGLDRDRRARCRAAAAGRRRARRPARQAVLDLVPQAGAAQRPLDAVVEVRRRVVAAQPQAGGDVVEDRHRRERVRLLEDHADHAADRGDVDRPGRRCRRRRAGTVALDARAGDLLVHAVDAAHERRLAAARRADHRRHLVGAVVQVDALDGVRCRRSRR